MAVFLGLSIIRDAKNGIVTLTQEGLTDRVINAMSLQDTNHNFTPADKIPLHKDSEGENCAEEWNYRSIVGMLLYLAGSTRSDIAYAVYQCTRFSHNPRRSHEVPPKQIRRYLKGTKTKGFIMKPDEKRLSLPLFGDTEL